MNLIPARWATDSRKDRFLCSFEERGGCWIWDGETKPSGYGQTSHCGKKVGAHRVSWMLFRGPIPEGLHVLHKCDVRNCVNPDHLWLGTHRDNMRDMCAKGRSGSRRGAEARDAKLTPDQVREVLATSTPGTVLGRRFGVAKNTIYAIRNGKTWRCISAAPKD